MLVLTGREARTLPAPVVRGLFWRVYAQQLWSPAIAGHGPLRKGASATEAGEWIAVDKAVTLIKAVLFPEDDDG